MNKNYRCHHCGNSTHKVIVQSGQDLHYGCYHCGSPDVFEEEYVFQCHNCGSINYQPTDKADGKCSYCGSMDH